VIPNLLRGQTQDMKARWFIDKSLSSICNLSITIQEAAELVQQSRGSPDAIATAQQTIPGALDDLKGYINEASTLENAAVKTVVDKIGQLYRFITLEAATCNEKKAEITTCLEKRCKEREKLSSELHSQKGNIPRFFLRRC
ncbi:unnamed protein product, partial [Rotaria socialis]